MKRLHAVRATAMALLTACSAQHSGPRRPTFAPPRDGVFVDPVTMIVSTGDDMLPALTPGGMPGGAIAYAGRANGNLDILVRPLDGSAAAVRLTNNSTDDTDPAWSPDGTWLAWVSQADDVKGDVWIMRADGKDKRRLTGRDTSDQAPTWSPDGRTIYFTCRPPGVPLRRIDAVNVADGNRTIVAPQGWDASVSPDGAVLFYVRFDSATPPRPHVVARRLADGREVALTEEGSVEAAPHAAVGPNGGTVVVFARFVDDANQDGTIDVNDVPSLWAMDFDAARFDGAAAAIPRPLTAGDGGEIFASVLRDWLVYTAAGRGELAILALPLSGSIDPNSAAATVLQAGRSQSSPALRRLALRSVIAADPNLAPLAHYELSREDAERGGITMAQYELDRCIAAAPDSELAWVAQLEKQRLDIMGRVQGKPARQPDDVAFVQQRQEQVRLLAQHHAASRRVQVRAVLIIAEADLALRQPARAVHHLEDLLATLPSDGSFAEDGARALDLLGERYAQMADLAAVARVSQLTLRRFADNGFYTERAADRWVDLASRGETLAPAAALEAILRQHGDLPVVAARAAAAQARRQDAAGEPAVAMQTWQHLCDTYASQRPVLLEALLALGELAGRAGERGVALGAYERVLAEFPQATDARAQARRGLTTFAMETALAQERGGALEAARATYERLLKSNREMVLATRRYIALSKRLGKLDGVLASTAAAVEHAPRDMYARYARGYALTFVHPPALKEASREIEAAIELEPRFAAAQLTLGWIRQMREVNEPGHGWLEAAAESFETARSLLDAQTDPELWAAATLNKGNALFALGKLDDAFSAYLERELAHQEFESPLAEIIFRESFSRVALRLDALDVALDMAYLARQRSQSLVVTGASGPRASALAGLLAAINLLTGRLNEALDLYGEAVDLYAGAQDWGHSIAMMRGKALTQQALGQDGAAMATFEAVLQLLATDRGPPAPPSGPLRTEIPATPDNITAAVYGFDGQQEEEIARASAGRILRRRLNFTDARAFDDRRLALVRQVSKQSRQSGRLQLELLYALHEAARAATGAGDLPKAAALWNEALPLCVGLGRWPEAATALEAVLALWLHQPELRVAPLTETAFAVATAGSSHADAEERSRLHRFLSLSHLAAALTPPAGGRASEAGLSRLLAELDRAAANGQSAAHQAADANDRLLAAHVEHLLGAPPSGTPPSPDSDDWRGLYDRSLWDSSAANPNAAWLHQAWQAALADPNDTVDVPERGSFVAAVTRMLVAEQRINDAWTFLETDRVRQLLPSDERRTSAAGRAPTGALAMALQGKATTLDALRGALQASGGALVQVFAPDAAEWHWFVIDGQRLEHVSTPPGDKPAALPASVAAVLEPAPETLYVDSGELIDDPSWPPTLHDPNSRPTRLRSTYEVLSATYLVAAYEARDWLHRTDVDFGSPANQPPPGPGWQTIPPDGVSSAALGALGATRNLHLALPAHAGHGSASWERPGLTQIILGSPGGEAHSIDLNDLAALQLSANLVAMSRLNPRQPRTDRAVAQGLLMAGVPVALLGSHVPSDLDADVPKEIRLFGYRPMDEAGQLHFAAGAVLRLVQGIGIYKKARANPTPELWQQARDALTGPLAALEFFSRPDTQKAAAGSQDKQVRYVMTLLRSAPSSVRGMLAESYANLKDYDRAVALRRTVLQDQQASGDAAAVGDALFNLGKNLFVAGRHDEAAKEFAACAKLAHEHNRPEAEAECQTWLGNERRALTDYVGAEQAFRAAIDLYRQGHNAALSDAQRSLGILYESYLNDYDKAQAQYEEALAGNAAGETGSKLQVDMARVNRLRGDYEEALKWVEKAHASADATPKSHALASLETANIYWYRGNYRRARHFQEEALALAQQSGAKVIEVAAHSLEGLIALNQGELQDAATATQLALDLARSLGDPREQAAQLNNLGNVQRAAGDLEAAMGSFTLALHLDEQIANTEGRAYDLRNIGVVQNLQGQAATSLATLDKALALSRSVGNRYNELQCLLAQGDVQETLHQAQAQATFESAAALAQHSNVPEGQWRALYALGRLHRAAGAIPAARQAFDAALTVVERLGRSVQENTAEHSRDALYTDAMVLAIEAGDLPAAYTIGERARARSALDVLASRVVTLASPATQGLIDEELASRESLVSVLRTQDANAAAVQQATARHDRAQTHLFAQAPALARAFTIAPVSLPAMQAVLPADMAVLSYVSGPHQTVAMIVRHDAVQATVLPIEQASLSALTGTLHAKMRAFAPVEDDLAALSDLLLMPLWQHLASTPNLVVVPHETLFALPFAALPAEHAPLWQHLALSQSLTMAHLHDDLSRPPAPRPQRIASMAPADDLPFARLEAAAVSDHPWLGLDATRAALSSACTSDALDIAAHGLLDARDPLGSALQLQPAADGVENGRLEIRFVFSLPCLPPLLTLSACDSAGGPYMGAEWLGMGQAFLAAGARTVVASHNRVSDLAAGLLMKHFYRRVRHEPTAHALQHAAMDLRERFPHPAHWANFVVLGDPR